MQSVNRAKFLNITFLSLLRVAAPAAVGFPTDTDYLTSMYALL